jgi:uncharacterized membrane protein
MWEATLDILYLEGDPCSPKYVRGTLEYLGYRVRLPDPAGTFDPASSDLVIVSDVPGNTLGDANASRIVDAVLAGTGLLLVGGWEGFGRGGWAASPLADASPVQFLPEDDRINAPSGLFVRRRRPHAITDGLPWEMPPVITGVNRIRRREATETVLEAAAVEGVGGDVVSLARDALPLLVLGRFGSGRVAAFTGDLAPHWSGGLTDWGGHPIAVGEGEEVGRGYAALLRGMCAWLARAPSAAQRLRTPAVSRA